MVLLQLGKEMQSETISDLTSSSPETESGESSLSNGHSLSDVINDWKRELEEKNSTLRDKIAVIHSLENELKHKNSEICDVRDRCNSVELDRDKNCQMVSWTIHHLYPAWEESLKLWKTCRHFSSVAIYKIFFLMFRCIGVFTFTAKRTHILQHIKSSFIAQVNQLKSAIQIHNESIQFLKRQNAELRDELDEAKSKVSLNYLQRFTWMI